MKSENNKFSGTSTPNAENNVSDVTNPLLTQILMKSENNKFSGTNTPSAENNVPAVTNPSRKQKAVKLFDGNFPGFKRIKDWITSFKVSSRKNIEVTIQLYCAQETVMTDYALQELEKKLTDHTFHDVMRLSVTICKDISSIQRDIPLIVICLSSSRLSVDLRNAISGVRTGSITVVLIFHHLKPHALPTESSHTILTKDEVSNVGIIIDVAFFETMGIYECDMNIKAFSTLITFIVDNYKE